MSYIEFIGGFLSSLLATLFYISATKLRPFFSKLDKYELTGLYAAEFEPLIPRESKSIEIIFITQKSENVEITLENYNSKLDEISYAKGLGKIRLNNFVVLYYSVSKSIPSVGAFLLKNETSSHGNILLSGYYVQYVETSDSGLKDKLLKVPYKLYKINIPILLLIFKKHFMKCQFNSYNEAKKWFEKLNLC